MSDSHQNSDNNFLPVIGILCIDIAQMLQKVYGCQYHSYIAVSYVKYMETAGAKVVPIWNNRPRSYYENIMNKINGILLPGGAIYFDSKRCSKDLTNDCYLSSKYIFDIAKNLNRAGKHFPLWGTCLGFQMMVTHSTGDEDIRRDCTNMKVSKPVKFEDDIVLEESKLFRRLDKDVKEKMSQQPFGYHCHQYCITKDILNRFNIDQHWRVLATNEDDNGLEFITIIEHKEFPFYGAQVHPERIVYEHGGPNDTCHHCRSCFELNQYFAKYFVQQCTLNGNRFADFDEEQKYNIYNFPITYTAPYKLSWQQCFLFKSDVEYPKYGVENKENQRKVDND